MSRQITLSLALLALACGPIGPFSSGQLKGELQSGPVAGWTFLDSEETVQLETRPDDPYSINIWIGRHDGKPYIVTSLILGEEEPSQRAWVQQVEKDPRVRIRVAGKLYERRAVRVSDPDEAETVRAKLMAKYEVESEDDGRTGRAWIFRLDAR